MKKFFAFAVVAVAATFASCAGNSDQNAQDSVAADSAVIEAVSAVADSAVASVDSVAGAAVAAVDSFSKTFLIDRYSLNASYLLDQVLGRKSRSIG